MPYTRNREQKEYAKERKKEAWRLRSAMKEKLWKERVSEIHTRYYASRIAFHLRFTLKTPSPISRFSPTLLSFSSTSPTYLSTHFRFTLFSFFTHLCVCIPMFPYRCLLVWVRLSPVSVFKKPFVISLPNSWKTLAQRDEDRAIWIRFCSLKSICVPLVFKRISIPKPSESRLCRIAYLVFKYRIVGFEIMRFVVFGSVIKTAALR